MSSKITPPPIGLPRAPAAPTAGRVGPTRTGPARRKLASGVHPDDELAPREADLMHEPMTPAQGAGRQGARKEDAHEGARTPLSALAAPQGQKPVAGASLRGGSQVGRPRHHVDVGRLFAAFDLASAPSQAAALAALATLGTARKG